MLLRRILIVVLVWGAVCLTGWLLFVMPNEDAKFDLTGKTFDWDMVVPSEIKDIAEDTRELLQDTGRAAAMAATSMLGVEYRGEDTRGNAWSVDAAEVSQEGQQVNLRAIEATTTNENANSLTFRAGEGEYDQTSQALNLKGDVAVSGAGLVLTTEKITGDLKSGQASTDGPVTIQTDGTQNGASAKIDAGNLQLEQHGAIIKLSGGVKGTFTPASQTKETTDSNAQTSTPTSSSATEQPSPNAE